MRWWIKLILGIAVIAALAWLAVRIGGFTLQILAGNGSGTSVHDPMFAEEPEQATQPPDLGGVEGVARFQDNSANWDTSVQTPVDQTVEELQQEAAGN